MAEVSKLYRGSAVGAVLAAALVSSAAHAQEQPKSSKSSLDRQDDTADIIVTAQKRAERSIDVPTSVTALSARDLEIRGTPQFEDIAGLIPNVSFSQPGNPNNAAFTVRGISQVDALPGLESAVGIYVDGVYVPGRAAANLDLIDIAQIEFLRGPQGTLFGKNTAAGAINIVSRLPDQTPRMNAMLEVGTYDSVKARASVSGPIVDDKVFVSLAASRAIRERGFQTNTAPGSDRQLNTINRSSLRGVIRIVPNDRFSLDIVGDYFTADEQSGAPEPDSQPATLSPDLTGNVSLNAPNDNKRNVWGISATAAYRFAAMSLTSVTGYRYYDERRRNDTDNSSAPFPSSGDETNGHSKSFSEELRLSSTNNGPFKWLIGGYFSHENLVSQSDIFDPAGTSTSVQADSISSYSAFGQADWHVLPRFTLTAGARITRDEKTGTITQRGCSFVISTNCPPRQAAGALTVDDSFAQTTLTPKVALRFELGQHANIYASYSEGYRPGGANGTAVPDPSFQKFAREVGKNYEAGIKGAAANGHIRFSLAGFFIDYRNIQVFQITPGTNLNFIRNAPKAESKGFESELNWIVSGHLRIGGSLGYTDARYKDFPNCSFFPVTRSCNGNRLLRSPKWSGSLTASGELPLDNSTQLFFQTDALYTGQTYLDIENSAQGYRSPYWVINGSVGIQDRAQRWSAALFAKNLLDTSYVNFFSKFPAGFTLEDRYLKGDPRTWGVRLALKF